MSSELQVVLGLVIAILVAMWSIFHFVQSDHEREQRDNMELVRAGWEYTPTVMGHWVPVSANVNK